MTTRKRIVFEGQDISLSTTMQKLQRQAEGMSSKLLERFASTAKSSKELNKLMEQEFQNNQRLIQLQGQDKKYQILEKHQKKLQEIDQQERKTYDDLRSKGLRGAKLDDAMEKASEGFKEKREAADTVKNESIIKLREALEEQKKTNDLLRQILNEDKNQWEQEFREDRKGVEAFLESSKKKGIENLSIEDQAKYVYQKSLVEEEDKKTEPKGERRSVLKDIIGAGLIRDIGGVISQMPNVRDAYDLIPGITRIVGAAGGGLVGAGTGAVAGALQTGTGGTGIGLGAMQGAALGAEVGQRAGDFAGQAMARFYNEQENLQKGRLGLKALTGLDAGEDFSATKYGISKAELFGVAQQMARQTGSETNDVVSLVGAQTGYGLDQASLMSSAGATRRTGGEFSKELSNLLGTAQDKGIDQILFNELVQNQTQLINSIGAMTEKVDPKNMTAILMELDSLSEGSGGFSMKDPRTMGHIQSIQSGLTSTNDFGKAMNLSVLRNMDPNASILDMLEMEEQGLGGERGREFLKGTVEQYSQMFGDEDLAVLALRQRFPGIPISDLKKLIRGQGDIDSMDTETMTKEADLKEQGNVAMRSQLQAAVVDAFASGPIEGLLKVEEQLGDIFARVLQQAVDRMDPKGAIEAAIKKTGGRIIDVFDKPTGGGRGR